MTQKAAISFAIAMPRQRLTGVSEENATQRCALGGERNHGGP